MKNISSHYSIFFILLLSLMTVPAAPAWWGWHHRVIAEIADLRLNPETRREVKSLLGEDTRLADVAEWADEVRPERWWTRNWHFINWSLDREEPDYNVRTTRGGNVVSAVEENLKIFRDREVPVEKRREALKFVIHFVGDIHQPLHAGRGKDRGGNRIPVLIKGEPTNLHAAWDGQLYDAGGDTPLDHAVRLLEKLNPQAIKEIVQGSPYDWAVESHRIDREFIYPGLDFMAIRDKEGTNPPELAGFYQQAARLIFRRRLMKAGIRLASLLNGGENTISAPGSGPLPTDAAKK